VASHRTPSGSPDSMMSAVAGSMEERTGRLGPPRRGGLHRLPVRRSEGRAPADLRPGPVVEELGHDVSVEGRGGYTPFVRRRQFAAVAAATPTRVDLGLRFTRPPASELLTPSRGPGQPTHTVGLTSPDSVTAEVRDLLRAAYQQNG
jgi:Domain of unknown function (DUF5655)